MSVIRVGNINFRKKGLKFAGLFALIFTLLPMQAEYYLNKLLPVSTFVDVQSMHAGDVPAGKTSHIITHCRETNANIDARLSWDVRSLDDVQRYENVKSIEIERDDDGCVEVEFFLPEYLGAGEYYYNFYFTLFLSHGVERHIQERTNVFTIHE